MASNAETNTHTVSNADEQTPWYTMINQLK